MLSTKLSTGINNIPIFRAIRPSNPAIKVASTYLFFNKYSLIIKQAKNVNDNIVKTIPKNGFAFSTPSSSFYKALNPKTILPKIIKPIANF